MGLGSRPFQVRWFLKAALASKKSGWMTTLHLPVGMQWWVQLHNFYIFALNNPVCPVYVVPHYWFVMNSVSPFKIHDIAWLVRGQIRAMSFVHFGAALLFVFFRPVGKTRRPPWPRIGWDIFRLLWNQLSPASKPQYGWNTAKVT